MLIRGDEIEAVLPPDAPLPPSERLDSTGATVLPGKLAELVVIDGDPLADIGTLQRASPVRNVLQASDRLRTDGFAGRLL